MSGFNWFEPKPAFTAEYKQDSRGIWHFVLRHASTVEAVSSVQGFTDKADAQAAVTVLARGFHIT